MERMLQKMARQLNAYDEASLISLWDKYATLVERFEPTKRWEEAAIIFSLIQAVRMKNQLFNHHLAAGVEASHEGDLPGLGATRAWLETVRKDAPAAPAPAALSVEGSDAGSGKGKPKKRCKVLRFRRRKSD